MISGKEFMNMTPEQIAKLFPVPRCDCGEEITEHPDEWYRISGRAVCSDCYFNGLGEIIEEHPIYVPRRRM